MKALPPLLCLRAAVFPLLFLLIIPSLFAAPGLPSIRSVERAGSNVVVFVQVPPGVRRVTLECRERLGGGAWEPRAVARLEAQGGEIRFELPAARQLELMRIRADATEALPSSFYSGTNVFYELGGGTSGMFPGAPGTTDATGSPSSTDASRAVVESDIWKLRGQTLYFFNQLRGLQVIDVSNPDAAVVRGTLELPATGEDLYLLGDKHVVLLARNGCSSEPSEVLIVGETAGQPGVVARLPVPGFIQESRLVGSALYVASQTFRAVPGTAGATWEWGTLVSSFDLAVPEAPVARSTEWLAGYGNVVTATDRLLFVSTYDPANWWQSIVYCLDITAPDGTLRRYETVRTAGQIADKFKLNWDGLILTTVSEDWRSVPGRRVTTHLETFRLPDPRSVGPAGLIKLGDLELGRGERLRATRFDGQRVYVVTFFQIDPLWVVDISKPASPRIVGSVDVPGWSTFIQPLGTRLVTIGIETNRVAVSLFNVSDPAAPTLSSRVVLGQNYSWSEANWDEKAFSVLPEHNLVLVPFSGDTTNGYAAQVQLIDLGADALTARGVIERGMQPRRATVYQDRILALSGWELLSVDAADRDHPVVSGVTPLAWPVDRVFLQGAYLIELGGASGGWWTAEQPVLRVAEAGAPDTVLSRLPLGDLPVLGATKRGSKLYLAQGQQAYYYPPVPLADAAGGATDPFRSKLKLSVLDLEALPAVRRLAEVDAEVDGLGYGGNLQAVWPKPGLLVFAEGGFNFWPFLDVAGGAMSPSNLRPFPFPGGTGGGHLIAFDVSDPASPKFASEVTVAGSMWGNVSEAFTSEGMVYLSHQLSEFVPWKALGMAPPADASGVIPEPEGTWLWRSYLDVVDYADATQPVVRKPVNIPGKLTGLSHQGAVIYTVGTRWSADAAAVWTEQLAASAYDGVAAHRIDSIVLPDTWPHPVRVVRGQIFIGHAAGSGGATGATTVGAAGESLSKGSLLETWRVSEEGRLVRTGSQPLAMPATVLADFDALLAVQQTDHQVVLLDVTGDTTPRLVGVGGPSGCVWFDLSHADGSAGRGLWLPLGAYGVSAIPASQPTE